MPLMVTPVEVGVVVLAAVGVVFAQRILSSIKALATNAVVGLITLIVASWFGFGITITLPTLAVTALAGVPGAILLLLLSHGGIAFTPAGVSEAGQLFADQFGNLSGQLVGLFL